MLSVRLPKKLEKKLDALARRTGRTKSFYVKMALTITLDEMESELMVARSVKKRSKNSRAKALDALHAESKIREREQILARLALPPNKRTHFLRMRFPWGGSAL